MQSVREPVRSVTVGSLALANNLVLAPMHEHTHLAMRMLARRWGAALAHTEMITPEELISPAGRKAANVLASAPDDRPLGVQLLPKDPGPLTEAVAMLTERRAADLVDLNFACPSSRVVGTGRGGAMLRKTDLAVRLVAAAVQAGPLPVTVKLRLGYTATGTDRLRALDLARQARQAGAAAVTLHARAVGQGYAGGADWQAIAQWSEALAPMPVFGSGDLRSPEAVIDMLRSTGCAGASIARGALGAPWIFRQAIDLATRGAYEPATLADRRRALLDHYVALNEQYGRSAAVSFMRLFGKYYARGLSRAATIRAAFQAAGTHEELLAVIDRWFADPVA